MNAFSGDEPVSTSSENALEGPPMTAIAVIATFVVVIFVLNVIDFGRLD
ncbi:MAG: hypothetical protein IV086_11280 [Hyphomonadaceae bacterium]|nr:hypothetical protein [Hyphomonadaceae bacterium]